MDEFMAASDILLGKPGGLTTAEALSRGLVFVIVNPVPGQEEGNSDHLFEEGVAKRCNNLPALAYKVHALMAGRAQFDSVGANARRMARPHAARDVVNRLLELHRDGS
jgi:processive 1,2-diacylglycerol beta-glucosyltransferase